MTRSPFSGEQIEIRRGGHRATITEVGATLRTYTLGGVDIVDGFGVDGMSTMSQGAVLAPFPNRIDGGRYTFSGEELQLPINEPLRHNAIHGLVRWLNWTLAERSESRAVMEIRLHPQTGYPFTVHLTIEYRLSASGLEVTTTAVNRGIRSLPYGVGAHPWVTVGIPLEDTILQVPAGRRLEAGDRMIPTGESVPVDGSAYDFLRPRPLGTTSLDTCFTGMSRSPDGAGGVTIATPGGDRTVTVWMDDTQDYLMIFTGDVAGTPKPRSLAIEPMSCAPNAFRTGQGLRILDPDGTFTSRWGITPRFDAGRT